LKLFFKNNLGILCVYLALLCIALFFSVSNDKKVIHLFLNGFVGNAAIDGLFYYITYLGDGTVAIILLAVILFYNVRLGAYATATFLTASLFSIGLKQLFFDDVNRPSFIFNYHEHIKLKFVEGVDIHIHNSFPSGHATQAFAILMCLAFTTNKQAVKFTFLMLALLTAYSRVHLSQHWLIDVTIGSLIGVVFSVIYYYLFILNTKLNRLNKPAYVFLRLWRKR
jgi:membrane-associated phospholipid phosphatase